MKASKHYLFLCLLLLNSLAGMASRKWSVQYYDSQGMPIHGYSAIEDNSEAIRKAAASNVFNMETDGGAKDHILTKARFDAAQWHFGGQPGTIKFPGKDWFIQDVNLNIPQNIILDGDGKYYTLFTVLPWVQTSFNDNLFISYGKSYITIQNFGIKTGRHKFNALFKFNSMYTRRDDVCKGITLQNLFIDSSWCMNYIRGGESGPGDTHCITDLNILNCELAHGGNPDKPYNVESDAPDVEKCHAINYSQTVQGGKITGNNIYDFSGDGFNWNPGFTDSNHVVPFNIGDLEMSNNVISNTYSSIASYNSFMNNCLIHDNTFDNPTGDFAVSFACANSKFYRNKISTYENRTAWEVYCADCSVDFGITTMYTGRNPNPATWRLRKADNQGQMMYTAGYNINYYGTINVDYSLGISPNCPDVRRGIMLTGHATTGYQPLVWKGKNYPNRYDFHCTLTGFTGRAIFAEQLPQSDVRVYGDCSLISNRVDPWENIVAINAPDAATGRRGWYFYNPLIDKRGSKLFDAGHAAIGFSDAQGSARTLSRINAVRLLGDTKAYNKSSQFSYTTTSKITYK